MDYDAFYRAGEAVEGKGGGWPARWVLIPSVFGIEARGEETGWHWLDAGKERRWRETLGAQETNGRWCTVVHGVAVTGKATTLERWRWEARSVG
jgi:hypothetical protein